MLSNLLKHSLVVAQSSCLSVSFQNSKTSLHLQTWNIAHATSAPNAFWFCWAGTRRHLLLVVWMWNILHSFCAWTFNSHLVMVFRRIVEPLGGGVSLKEVVTSFRPRLFSQDSLSAYYLYPEYGCNMTIQAPDPAAIPCQPAAIPSITGCTVSLWYYNPK